MATLDQVRRQLPGALLRLASLQRRAARLPETESRLVPEALAELERALHALSAECDRTRTLTDELARAHADTERKYRQYRAFFEQAQDAYLVTTGGGVIIEANPAAAALLNVGGRWLREKPLDLYIDAGRADFLIELRKREFGDAPTEFALRVRPRERASMPVTAWVRPIADAEDSVRLWWVLRPRP